MPRKPRSKRPTKAATRASTPSAMTPVGTVRLESVAKQPFKVKHLPLPPKFDKPKRIHPRRVLPFIREGLERQFHSTTRSATLEMAKSVAEPFALPGEDVVLKLDSELIQPGQEETASNVDEPSAAMNGDVAFYTGNWYAAMPSDGGRTSKYIDPATSFAASDPPNSHFCCDQVVNYIPSIDTFVWLLQYGPDTGDNNHRLALAKTADVVQGRWRLFDITTAMLGVPGAFLDFPDLAVGANHLYVTTNIFQGADQAGSGVLRIPIAEINSGGITASRYVSMALQSFRVAQNCGPTAYFAAHQDTSTLALFSWNENQDAPTETAVGVARWIGGNGYRSRTPDASRWLDRADPRLTGATMAGSELWFAWTVDSGSNQRPNPFVQIARISANNLTLIENINVFDLDSAIAYGALGTNAQGEVGISYMIGGGHRYPSHAVGILTNTRKDVIVATGDRGPLLDPTTGKGEWGDFLAVRPLFPDRRDFVATGYTMKGSGDGSNRDATPRLVVFGRAATVPGVAGPVGSPLGGVAGTVGAPAGNVAGSSGRPVGARL